MAGTSSGRRTLRRTAGTTVAVGVVLLAVAGITRDGAGLAAAAAGVLLVLVFFLAGVSPLGLVDRAGQSSPVALPVALVSYMVRVIAVAIVAGWLVRQPGFDRAAFGGTVIVCALAWPAAAAFAVVQGSPRRPQRSSRTERHARPDPK